jgi:hypothetical protein
MGTAELRRLHSPDVSDLKSLRPSGPFCLLVQAMVGPAGSRGEESFDILVCSPSWLEANIGDEIIDGRHHLIMQNYDYKKLWDYIASYCSNQSGRDWQEIAGRLALLGKWEFEDYRR